MKTYFLAHNFTRLYLVVLDLIIIIRTFCLQIKFRFSSNENYSSGVYSIYRKSLVWVYNEGIAWDEYSYDSLTKIVSLRMILGEDVDNATIEGSTIRIYPDLTSIQIWLASEHIQSLCLNQQISRFPIPWREPFARPSRRSQGTCSTSWAVTQLWPNYQSR